MTRSETIEARDPSIVIDVKDLRFSYGPGLPDVLKGVDLRVRQGEFVALLGQNGAGKTTLAKHLNGLHQPTSGEVRVAGKRVADQPLSVLARSVGYCYQNPDHQIFSSSVAKEVGFGPTNLGYSSAEVDELVSDALDLVGIAALRDAHPFTLGRGQRQLVAVASILAMDPRLLVIDEPTTGMDRVGGMRAMGLLSKWASEGRTILVITHDMDLVSEFIDRSVVMAGGRILADGPTQDVFRDTAVLEEAHLMAPAPVTISDRLERFGVDRAKSISEAVGQLVGPTEGR
ncbi:energy-coupling factor ABC transporter ATP-binding protein [Leifsonia sp. NPDC056665]|uniref:energy-coupling factor ABC transporter ATP-binding protein n=1 Tax=Leifsonia sp. NPDC056665 TaxID=3345901 RepID=UPI0036BE29C8